jgi:hypothetical protein
MKKYIALLLIALIAAAGVFFFFYRFYQHDMTALTEFTAAYENYDRAISDFSGPVLAANPASTPAADELERKADAALLELGAKASVRISSMIKNEKEIMSATLEIADLAGKELDALKTYQQAAAGKDGDLVRLAKEFADLTNSRRTAYARFLALGE